MDTPDAHPGRWRMLLLLCVAETLGMSLWLTASAVSPQLAALWSLDRSEVGWLTTLVQLGFVVGTAAAALLNLADLVPPRAYFAAGALLAAAANVLPALVPVYGTALVSRFLTGIFLAGVYPPVMKMAATWFRSGRGLAIGAVVGALVAGKAVPYLFRSSEFGWKPVVLGSSAAAALAALLLAAFYRPGPHAFARSPFSWGLVRDVLRHRPTRLAIGGYLGHMWELYAMWGWAPAFLAAALGPRWKAGWIDWISFGAIAAGGLGSVWAGWAADRIGRPRVVNLAMGVSGTCALLAGLCFGASAWILVPLMLVWGASVVADSAQFSAMVTESAPPYAVGTALTLQTSLGFLLSMVTLQGVPLVVDAAGWPWAFCGLSLGPALGILAIRRLARRPAVAAS